MKSPKALGDLPFAPDLAAFGDSASLGYDGDYDRVLFAGRDFTGADAGGARFTECAFTDGTGFDGGQLRRARFSDVWFAQARMVSLDLAESSLTDVWLTGCVLAGVQAFSLAGRRLLLRGCKLDSVNFRDSRLTDVVFEDCTLRDADFGSAKLTRVAFPGCTLVNADFTRVACKEVDLRGARLGLAGSAPGIRAGYDSLAGVRIDGQQLITLAPLLAGHLGLTVTD